MKNYIINTFNVGFRAANEAQYSGSICHPELSYEKNNTTMSVYLYWRFLFSFSISFLVLALLMVSSEQHSISCIS